MSQHPLILAHNQTYDRRFPLILIVGREPNNESISNGNIGLLDFVKHSRCAFWNVAFGTFGTINGTGCKQMKNEFIRRKASPFLFVDSFPQGIKNKVIDKHSLRALQQERAHEQIDAIFKYIDVINRVKIVLLSGLDNPVYENFKTLLKNQLADSEVVIREIPFLYPTNTSKILNALTVQDKELLKGIYKSFIVETDETPVLSNELLKKYEMDAPDTPEGIIDAY